MTPLTLPPTTAVLVVDMQNDNLHPDGAFAATGAAEHAQEQNVVANVRAVLDAARAADIAVFHNRIVVYPGRGVGGSNAPIFRMLGPESLKLGSWGAAIVDGLDPREDELVLDRMRMSAFNGTSLDIMLRNLGVTHVVTVVSDATSSVSAEWQRAALSYALTNIATVATTAEVAQALSAS